MTISTYVPQIFDDRFRADRLVKQGQGVSTLAGFDLQEKRPVIVKTASTDSITLEAQLRLEHEAEVLRDLRPAGSPVVHFGRQDSTLFLVMPLVEGVPLQHRLACKPLSVTETMQLATDILSALDGAHERGVLHRDIKPANIIVSDSNPLKRATLIDFGLARSNRLAESIREQPVGTIRYIAPEQAGLLRHDVDERSDLYSVGTVLFECLAGRPLFDDESVGEVLRAHATGEVPQLRRIGVAVPRALDELIARLLQKDPRERYQSAKSVLADLSALTEAMARGDNEPSIVVGLHDRRAALTHPAFVGRESELAAVNENLQAAWNGNGGLVLLEAISGGGKTRLLDEIGQQASRRGALVFGGQGVDQSAMRPFEVLVGVGRDLIAAANGQPAWAARVRTTLGDHAEAAVAALPELANTLQSHSDGRLGPEDTGEIRSLRSLSRLLDSLGDENCPAVVLLDDCQWSDELTLKLLDFWNRRHLEESESPARHVLIVAAFRTEEVSAEHLLRHAEPMAHYRLAALERDDICRMAESMAGALPPAALDVVHRLSEGNPFLASAVLRGLVETGALVEGADGWKIDEEAMADVQTSRRAAAFLARRLKLLPERTLWLLSVAAVLGKEFDLRLTASLAGQNPRQIFADIDMSRRRHIVWQLPTAGRYSFVHDKLRETLLEMLPNEDRVRLHLASAEYLEKTHPDNVFELAYHFDAGGDSVRALPYALAAASQARARHALEIAERQYRIAGRGAEQGNSTETAFQVAEGLGDALMLRGKYDEAAEQFEAALPLAQDNVTRAKVEGKLGELAFKRGDVERAAISLEKSLRLLGRFVPRSTLAVHAMCGWEIIVQAFHTFFPRLLVARRTQKPSEAETLSLNIFSRIAYAYWFGRGTASCLWAHLRGMNIGEKYQPTPELAQAYSEHAPAMTMVPLFKRGLSYVEQSLQWRKKWGDVWGEGQSLHFAGVVLYSSSRYLEAMEKCREAVRLLQRTGDQWEVNTASWHIAICHYRLGNLDESVRHAQRVYNVAMRIGDYQAAGICLGIWSKASDGDVPHDFTKQALERNVEDVHTMSEVLVAEAARRLRENQPEEAIGYLQQAHRLVRAKGLRQEYVSPIYPWLATALRTQASMLPPVAGQQRKQLLRRARKVVRKALRVARVYRNNLPHALREEALIAATLGDTKKARRSLERSLHIAEQQGAKYEYAQSLLACGETGLQAGWPNAPNDVAKARRLMSELREDLGGMSDAGAESQQVTLSLADRFSTVLDAGRQIATSLSRESVFEAVLQASLQLLRADRCVLLEVDSSLEQPRLINDSQLDTPFSRTMVQRAVETGRCTTFIEGENDSATESVLLSGVRSALCVPIFIRGDVDACIYATHLHLGGMFDQEEQRLAEYIATAAGAALENAAGFAELTRLNEALRDENDVRQLAEEKLRQKNSELEEFLYTVSHDLKSPIVTAQGFAEIVREEIADGNLEEASDAVERIQRATSRMDTLVRHVLELSRIGQVPEDPVDVDVTELVEVIAVELGERFEQAGATLEIEPEMPHITMDRQQLYVVFENLLINALKYACVSPGVKVRVGCVTEDDQHKFFVSDTGPGIEPQYQSRIFSLFQRLASDSEGSGVGLSIVARTMEVHGGRTWLESELGQGATFWLAFPTE